jgi:hypothetical protein
MGVCLPVYVCVSTFLFVCVLALVEGVCYSSDTDRPSKKLPVLLCEVMLLEHVSNVYHTLTTTLKFYVLLFP